MDEHVHDPDHPHEHEHEFRASDCVESLESLYVFLDGELTTERRVAIRGHLDGCTNCYGAYDFEAELRAVVSASCREEVPDHLRQRVAEALRQLQDG